MSHGRKNNELKKNEIQEESPLIAENQITITRSLFEEGRLASRSSNYRKTVIRLSIVLALLLAATALWLICTDGPLIYLAGETIFIIALLCWLIFILPRTGGKRKFEAMTQGMSQAPRRTTRFFKDHFEVLSETGKRTSFDYSDILRITESRNLWVLICKDKSGILLKKDGFTLGKMDIVLERISNI